MSLCFVLTFYILRLYDRFYVGHCSDVQARLTRHNLKMVPSTRNYTPWNLVYYEEFDSRAEAGRRELEIKRKKSKKYIEWLIQNGPGRHVPM